ncbi:MAG: M12 family metallopeptidase [Desulfobacteraceae bacterium]|nr:M12 family metallopeptidase [Desulfobacteraceae bacterium]
MKTISIKSLVVLLLGIMLVACGGGGGGGQASDQDGVQPEQPLAGPAATWPYGQIDFLFTGFDENEKQTMREWMLDIEYRSNQLIAFTEVEELDAYVLEIIKGIENYAVLGFDEHAYAELISVDEGTFKRAMFRVFGFDYEFNRSDRDEHVTIVYDNMDEIFFDQVQKR